MINKILFLIVVLFSAFNINVNAQDSIASNYNSEWKKKIDKETSEIKNKLLQNESNKLKGIENSNQYIFCYSGDNYLELFEGNNAEDQSYLLFEGKEIKTTDYLGFEGNINQLFKELDINYKRKVIIYVTDIVHPEISPLINSDGKEVNESDFNKEFTKQCFSYLLTKLYGAQSGEFTMLAYLRVFRTQKAYFNSNETRFEYTHKRVFNYQKGLPNGCISLLENKIVKNEDNIFKSNGDQSGQIYECAKLIHSTLKAECPSVINPMLPLTVTERIAKIKEYLIDGLNDKEEGQVLNLISETPTSDISNFLLELQKDNLIYNIIGSTQNSIMGFYGGNNYAQLMRTFTTLVLRQESLISSFDNMDIEDFTNRVVFWDSKSILSTPTIGYNHYNVEMLEDGIGQIKYTRFRVTGINTIYVDDNFVSLEIIEDEMPCPNLKPFDLILFFNRSNLGLIEEGLPQSSAIKMVPAIFLKYAFDMKFNDDALKSAALTGDIITIASGPGLIIKAGWVMRAFILLEMAGAVGNITIQVADLENSKYSDLVDRYNLIMAGAGVVNLGITTLPGALSAAKNISKGIGKKLTGEYISWVMTYESELLSLSKNGNKSAEDILKLKATLFSEWKIKFGDFDRSFYAIVLTSGQKILHYGGWGGDVKLFDKITTTVIGKWFDETNGYGTKQVLNIAEGSFTRGLPNPGGINILDLPSDIYNSLLKKNFQKYYDELFDNDFAIDQFVDNGLTKIELKSQPYYRRVVNDEAMRLSIEDGKDLFWEQYNLPFLKATFERGDNVRLLSDPDDTRVLFGFFKREIEAITGTNGKIGLLDEYGYKFNKLTSTYEKIK